LARWQHDSPDSAALAVARTELRKHMRGEYLSQENLDSLASLFGDGPGRVNLQGANALTDLYLRYYYHGEPFRPDAVRAAWRSCLDMECMRARPAAERRLDGLRGRG
jgi:hypothetical protein